MQLTARPDLLTLTNQGLYCPQGDFYIDPWRAVDRAIITHAHSDHARSGMGTYVCPPDGREVLALRVGQSARIQTFPFGESSVVNGVRVSLHPAGHIIGSCQVRIELDGEVAVVSGDYKVAPDPTCAAFEPVPCHVFVTESTFGLPIYRWPTNEAVFAQINQWWRQNQAAGRCSILMGYSLGKSQRAIAGLDPEIGPIFLHGALGTYTQAYRNAGIALPETRLVGQAPHAQDWSQAMVLAPPSAAGTPWLRRFRDQSTAFMSGWMAIRGARRRRALDRGFVLSDHIDWAQLMQAVSATGAERVFVTHGYTATVVRHLRERGLDARPLSTRFEGETLSTETETEAEAEIEEAEEVIEE